MKIVNLEDVIERLQYWSGGFDYVEVPTDYAVEQMENLPAFELVRCRDCKHFHENVWGNEIGLDDLPIIVGHEACDAWGREWTQSFADGFCHMAERRNDG